MTDENQINLNQGEPNVDNQRKGCCFFGCKFIEILKDLFFIGLLSYMLLTTTCYSKLWIWSVLSLSYNVIDIIQTIHVVLKEKYTQFVLQKRFLKFCKRFLYLTNNILLFAIIILGSDLNQNFEHLKCPNYLVHHNVFTIIFTIQCLSLGFFLFVLVFLLVLLSVLYCSNNTEQKKGAKPETVSHYTVIKTFQEWVGIDTQQCAICMDEYIEDQRISKLSCGHFYHQECVEEWLKQSEECPYCRQKIAQANDLHS